MLKRLLDRLHSVFDKTARVVSGISIDSPVTLTISIRDYVVTATDGTTTVTVSGNTTVQTLATEIASTFSATSTVNPDVAGYHACFLIEGDYSGTDMDLLYPTAILFNEMQLYARLLTEQGQRLNDATKQAYMLQSDGKWLDYWARDHFGIPRLTWLENSAPVQESDSDYKRRVIYELLRPVANNKALEGIIEDTLGIGCQVTDAYPVSSNTDDIGRFIVKLELDNSLTDTQKSTTIDKAYNIVNRYKAAGTAIVAGFRDRNAITETVSVAEIYAISVNLNYSEDAYDPAVLKVGAGWKCGTPGLKVGTNAALIEQVYIEVRSAADHSVISTDLYGG